MDKDKQICVIPDLETIKEGMVKAKYINITYLAGNL